MYERVVSTIVGSPFYLFPSRGYFAYFLEYNIIIKRACYISTMIQVFSY